MAIDFDLAMRRTAFSLQRRARYCFTSAGSEVRKTLAPASVAFSSNCPASSSRCAAAPP